MYKRQAEKRAQRPEGINPGDVTTERREAAVTACAPLIGAGAGLKDLRGTHEDRPQPRRAGEFGEIAGAAGHGVVQEEGRPDPTCSIADRVGRDLDTEVVGGAAHDLA